MLLRRKLCVALLIAAILFLMLASQSIQRRNVLPQSLSRPTFKAMHASRETVVDHKAPLADLNPDPPVTPPPPRAPPPKDKEEPAVDSQKVLRSCGCSGSCISDPGESIWFSQHYDAKQQPVLRDANNNLDPDALRWWMGLQRSGNSTTLEEVMSEMFKVISSPTVDFKPLPSLCRRCAVVGNSGNLRESGHGDLINSHNSVIRMNKAVTRGFEKDVGSRTTHHLLYPESAVDMGQGESLVLLPFKLRDLEWLTSALSTGEVKMTYMRVKDRVEADKDKVLVMNPVFFKYVHDHWTEHHGRYPSTGMLAIIFALHTCDQVSVFGYGADKQGNWHHYWEENRNAGAFRKTGVHSADFEIQVIQQLAKEGKISLHL
ncbi:ST3 beta-galactoside alpha-2,3-sialyltransferase 8 [Pleuronectes platessa]|uniref:ST3 beta-galactoside alpha-2,3-sialyltransferase 8 n=1 Tax=Pleuronectes platessa TaxID=8262 RepID=UPI00232A346B|nr:ST3 beta-galactoside alpha-2,3-sialyltransferase 8 [Pleuronectes platessa]XP_053292040.1 ST3 beta-galactoside alpha-2,3-sialyltransferase 8 [Pleuronectes platessa]XP_053292048.1 ST3 beta-galactoside alpha-2,3-sialyltransferase 8 [Pleuronectes platessa]XP_053292058.1 ST3 beta-galactoside alpha-2,3-sialyltransferase 8 [Pleuronectes platessa]XP_053292068.1 ST3 beta-galactoside alpha-2,3-sialyltransferase 8 [Pleuronectes platessa]XP_053292076.1 ST3 beta-galactoside alpha-2,3-sialyltransferase 8